MSENLLDAIHPEKNAVISASAGTGKTWMLVSRIIRLLIQGAPPSSIIAITFTRKAAEEMRSRLMDRVLELATAPDEAVMEQLKQIGLDDSNKHLSIVRNLLDKLTHSLTSVTTTTFHSFCNDLLSRFPLEADIPPGYTLAESTDLLQEEAWQALNQLALQKEHQDLAKSLEQLYITCGSISQTKKLMNVFLDHRTEWWGYTSSCNDNMEETLQKLETFINPETNSPYEEFLAEIKMTLLAYTNLMVRHETKTNLRKQSALKKYLSISEFNETVYNNIRKEFISSGKWAEFKTSGALKKSLGENNMFEAQRLHEEIISCLEKTDMEIIKHQTVELTKNWFIAGNAYINCYQQIKSSQRVLDFTDLEWHTYRLLNDSDHAQWIQYKLDQKIKHLLIDEFQDTNPTQWKLVLPVLQSFEEQENRQKSAFLVGDEKQSIYQFRRADPRVFHHSEKWMSAHLDSQTFEMTSSRRSAPEIIEFVNRLFTHETLTGKLQSFKMHDTYNKELPGGVYILPLTEAPEKEKPDNKEFRNPLLQPRTTDSDSQFFEEGRLISRQIRTLIQAGTKVTDTAKGQIRPAKYSDILILVRNRTHLEEIEAGLQRENTPFIGTSKNRLLDTLEAQDLLTLLDFLVTPVSDLALARILRTPLFNCSNEDLIFLSTQATKKSWWKTLDALINEEDYTPENLRIAYEELHRWMEYADILPVHDLLDKVYSESNIITRYQKSYPTHLSKQVEQNLIQFIQLALEVDSGRYPSIMRFTTELKSLATTENDSPDQISPSMQEDRITITTVHGAKGLEAPIVFLSDAHFAGKRANSYRVNVEWPPEDDLPQQFFIAPNKPEYPEPLGNVFRQKEAAEDLEDANLLYVAITRPRQYLIITGSENSKANENSWYRLISKACSDYLIDDLSEIFHPSEKDHLHQSSKKRSPDQHVIELLHSPLPLIPTSVEIAPSKQVRHKSNNVDMEEGKTRGITIHAILQKLTNTESITQNEIEALTGTTIDHDLYDQCLNEAKACLNDSELDFIFSPRQFDQAFNEIAIQFQTDQGNVYGIIDRLILTEDRAIIVDYKTHQVNDRSELDRIAQEYSPQMLHYKEGVRILFPELKIEAYILFTHTQSLVSAD